VCEGERPRCPPIREWNRACRATGCAAYGPTVRRRGRLRIDTGDRHLRDVVFPITRTPSVLAASAATASTASPTAIEAGGSWEKISFEIGATITADPEFRCNATTVTSWSRSGGRQRRHQRDRRQGPVSDAGSLRRALRVRHMLVSSRRCSRRITRRTHTQRETKELNPQRERRTLPLSTLLRADSTWRNDSHAAT
jgi:hypothetical protein